MSRTPHQQIRWYRRAQWATAGAAIVSLAFCYTAFYRPASRGLGHLREDLLQKQAELNIARVRVSSLGVIQADVSRMQSGLEGFGRDVPGKFAFAAFLKEMTEASRQSAVHAFTCEPGIPRKIDHLREQPITIRFEGDFFSVFAFLRQAEDSKYLSRVRGLSLKTKDANLGRIEAQIAMSLYCEE